MLLTKDNICSFVGQEFRLKEDDTTRYPVIMLCSMGKSEDVMYIAYDMLGKRTSPKNTTINNMIDVLNHLYEIIDYDLGEPN